MEVDRESGRALRWSIPGMNGRAVATSRYLRRYSTWCSSVHIAGAVLCTPAIVSVPNSAMHRLVGDGPSDRVRVVLVAGDQFPELSLALFEPRGRRGGQSSKFSPTEHRRPAYRYVTGGSADGLERTHQTRSDGDWRLGIAE
ncbi:MAG TPA: hypothetical protein VEA69_08155, partial [Tepidisphaeraceae bacterium]|nr:hypothetical protein [Tepidisphaeraceae bacterium]